MTQQMSERQGVPIYFVHYNKLVIVRQAFLLKLILVILKCSEPVNGYSTNRKSETHQFLHCLL